MAQITWRESTLSSRKRFTVLLLAFLFHNAEETYSICHYAPVNPFPAIQTLSCLQFLVAVSVISAAGVILFSLAVLSSKQQKYLLISTGLSAALLLNAIVPHIVTGLLTLKYTPGLFTAVFLILPLSLILLKTNRQLYESRARFGKHIILFLVPAYLFFALVTRLTLSVF